MLNSAIKSKKYEVLTFPVHPLIGVVIKRLKDGAMTPVFIGIDAEEVLDELFEVENSPLFNFFCSMYQYVK